MTYKGMLNAGSSAVLGQTDRGGHAEDSADRGSVAGPQDSCGSGLVEEHREQIEVSYLPPYAPELNPVEYLNNDMKGTVNEGRPAAGPGDLAGPVAEFHDALAGIPKHVISYFLHPWSRYAAPVELLDLLSCG